MDLADYPAAVEAARTAIAADRALQDPWGVAINQCNLVVALLNSEGPHSAYDVLREVAGDAVALGDIELSIDVIDTSAAVWAALGHAEQAATLLGTAQKQREVTGIPRPAPDQHHLDRFIEPARRTLPDEVWSHALSTGAGLTIDDAIVRATSDISAAPTPAGTSTEV
jgi:hypothetical protein